MENDVQVYLGERLSHSCGAFALSGRFLVASATQGVALGYWQIAPSGRLYRTVVPFVTNGGGPELPAMSENLVGKVDLKPMGH